MQNPNKILSFIILFSLIYFMKKIIVILLVIALIFAFGCTETSPDTNNNLGGDNMSKNDGNTYNNLDNFKKVKAGDKVSVHYTGKLETGEVFDSSVGKTPLAFTAGAGQMIKGFDNAVIGMKVGDKKTITISPAEGYGVNDPSKVVLFDKNDVPDFEEMQVGMQVQAGNGMPGTIISKEENSLVIDFNHFLAGKTLIFEIEMVSIN